MFANCAALGRWAQACCLAELICNGLWFLTEHHSVLPTHRGFQRADSSALEVLRFSTPCSGVHGAARVPTGLLTRQQAWSLAHAADFVATTTDEMVDPWD